MHIHEYQAKQLLDKYGVPIPRGGVASTVDEAVKVAQDVGGSAWVVKAQIHAGGRRAGHFEDAPQGEGGVRFARSLDDLRRDAEQMLGHVLVTAQTGSAGREVERVYVEQSMDVERELYLGMLVDRHNARVTLIASAAGGINIETIAAEHPESMLKLAIDPIEGLTPDAAVKLAADLGLEDANRDAAASIVRTMYRLFVDLDASLIEINPLAVTDSNVLMALDATLTFDDNALFRHQDIAALRDEAELRFGELQAVQHGINYVKLDGNIGCMATGAGTALATLDAVKLFGGEPANFLDLPPVAQVGRVREALNLIVSDPAVECILVNVFGGGIMRCDTIADGIIMTNRERAFKAPLIVRLAGTNATFAIRRLRDSGPDVVFANDLADAAERAVKAAKERKLTTRRAWWQRVRGSAAHA